MIDVRTSEAMIYHKSHSNFFQSQMNFSPFHDDIFTTSNHASALDIIGLSSSHIFKDNQSQCFDHFQNVYAETTYPIMSENAGTLVEKNVPNSTNDNDIFGWCHEEPRPSFSPTYNYSGGSMTETSFSSNNYQNTDNFNFGAGAATLTLPTVEYTPNNPTLVLPGVSEPGVSEPGVSEPGVSEPGVSEPGVSEPVPHTDGVYTSVISNSSDTNYIDPKIQPATMLQPAAVTQPATMLQPATVTQPAEPKVTQPATVMQPAKVEQSSEAPSLTNVPVSMSKNPAAAPTVVTTVPAVTNSTITVTSSNSSVHKPTLILSQPAFIVTKPPDESRPSAVSKPPVENKPSVFAKDELESVTLLSHPEGDLLSELTKEILFSKSRPRRNPVTPGSSILQSVYNESQKQNKSDGSEFLTPLPETAPAIPSLPQSLASKIDPEHKNGHVIKFRRAYKRTTARKRCDADLNSGGEEETGPSSNTRLAKQQKECLLDTIDDLYQREEIKGQQINVNVYRQIKSCNERDLDKGNFSGYVVSDASCFEGCKPFNGHRVKRYSETHDEINVGTLASCKRLGVMRKVRTPDGQQVNVISPRPKYQIGRCGTPKMVSSGTPKKVSPPKLNKIGCNTCEEKFSSCRLLFSHILKWHTPRNDVSNI